MKLTTAMLADAARIESGKLYIHGGGWDAITAAGELPVIHPTMAFAMILRLEYSEALEDIPVTIELVDEDENPMGPRAEFVINAGHAPRKRRGTPIFIPQTITVNSFPFPKPGGYRFRVTSRDEELGDAPFSVTVVSAPVAPRG